MKLRNSASFILLLLLVACSPKITSYPSAEVSYLSGESSSDQVAIQARGYASKSEDVKVDAEKRAFEYLLFRGIPDSPQRAPMVADANARKKHDNFFTEFFDKQGYRNYMTETTALGSPVKDKEQKNYNGYVKLKINIRSLRRDLEQQKVIARFGL